MMGSSVSTELIGLETGMVLAGTMGGAMADMMIANTAFSTIREAMPYAVEGGAEGSDVGETFAMVVGGVVAVSVIPPMND